ncbi:MAG: FAD-binding protein [Deltaproteobacteria bacterium]|jgi:glycolate oxidase|nr:FAD-binding protein [Deltaproteobacteria bacterium]
MNSSDIIENLIKIVGADNVVSTEENLICYLYNAGPRQQSTFLPVAAIVPENTEQISALLRFANTHKIPVIPRGQASGLSENTRIEQPDTIILSMAKFTKLQIDPNTLTATVGPGVVTINIKKAAAEHGLLYPPDPASYSYSTIGGNVSTDAGGLQCVKYGTTKSYVAGLTAVLPSGDVIHTGGKCIKDVTGYNLTQLLTGSEGTLCVITEIILKLIPQPEGSKVMRVIFNDLENAAKAISAIMVSGVVPSAMEFMDNYFICAVEEMLHAGFHTDAACMLLIEVDGPLNTLDGQAEAVTKQCLALGATEVRTAKDKVEAEALWAARRLSLNALSRKAKSRLSGDPAAPIDRLPQCLAKLKELENKYGIIITTYGHAGDGNLHPCFLFNSPEEKANAIQARDDFYEYIITIGGTVSAEHGVGREKIKYIAGQLGKPQLALMVGIKKLFDPNNILNPGCVLGEYLYE